MTTHPEPIPAGTAVYVEFTVVEGPTEHDYYRLKRTGHSGSATSFVPTALVHPLPTAAPVPAPPAPTPTGWTAEEQAARVEAAARVLFMPLGPIPGRLRLTTADGLAAADAAVLALRAEEAAAPTSTGWTAERVGGRIVANHPDGRRISRNDSVPDEDLLHEMAENDEAWEAGFQAIFAVRAEEVAAAAPATTDDDREEVVARALAESNGTAWDLIPQDDDIGDDVYRRDARAVLAALDAHRAAGSPS